MDRNSKNKICAVVICGAFLIGALGGLGISPREAERMTERNEAQPAVRLCFIVCLD